MEGVDPVTRDTVLDVRELSLDRGTRRVLNRVTLQVARGELVALMGLSGGGKTTILRVVAGLEPFASGTVEVDSIPLQAGAASTCAIRQALQRKVGFVFQFHFLFEHLTALQNVTLAPLHVHKVARSVAEERGRTLLDRLGVGGRANALPRELSGGEAQRVAIARALAVDPPLLLMDEPTASLDPARRAELGHTLCGLTATGRTLLTATHDDDFVRDYATRVIVLDQGAIVEEGMPDEILVNPKHPATIRLLQKGDHRTG